jgi:hypothetical protein
MPFLGAEMALPCVLERRVGISPSLAPAAKEAGFLGRRFGRHFGWVLPASDGQLEEESYGQKRLTVNRTIRAGFSSKRYRKGTRLVQEEPVTRWIWCSWNERENVGAWTKPIICKRHTSVDTVERDGQHYPDQELVVLRQSSLTEWPRQVWERGKSATPEPHHVEGH